MKTYEVKLGGYKLVKANRYISQLSINEIKAIRKETLNNALSILIGKFKTNESGLFWILLINQIKD